MADSTESSPRHFNGEVHYSRKELARMGSRRLALGSIAGIAAGLCFGNLTPIEHNLKAAMTFNDTNDRVSDIATELNGSPIRVDCDDSTLNGVKIENTSGRPYEVEGVVQPLSFMVAPVALPVVTLREKICETIIKFDPHKKLDDIQGDELGDYIHGVIDYAADISILLHEEEHTHQEFSESAATCYAFQKLPSALGKLGLTSEVAHFAAQNAAYNVAPGLEPSYLSTQCKPDGALDLHISDIYIHANQ